MKKCARCYSSMLLDFADVPEGGHQVWRCLGCGRETYSDPVRQSEDERLLARIRQGETGGRRARI